MHDRLRIRWNLVYNLNRFWIGGWFVLWIGQGWDLLTLMLYDLKYVLRTLRKSPGFTLVVVATLALGIGANTAIFSVLQAALFRPLPYPSPDRLVEIWSKSPDTSSVPYTTGPQLKDWREHAQLFDGIAGMWNRLSSNLIVEGRAERINGAWVSANYLTVLGIHPQIGRDFQRHEDALDANDSIVILTYEAWQSRLGGDPKILGKTLNLGGWHCAVIGVLPPHALADKKVEYLQPLLLGGMAWELKPDNPWLNLIGRLKPGVTAAQGEAELNNLSLELYSRILPSFKDKIRVQVLPMQAQMVAEQRPTLIILFCAVALVLIIACANAANLLLARATVRQKEMSVRAALGSTRGRIMRLALTESGVLSLAGGGLGVGLAAIGIQILGRITAQAFPEVMQPRLDGTVLAFCFGLACLTGILFGSLPARRAAKQELVSDLKDAGRGSTSARGRLRAILIIAEIALTVVLLIGTGLLLRSFARMLAANFGFEPKGAMVCEFSLTMDAFYLDSDPPKSDRRALAFERMVRFQSKVVSQLEALGDVDAAGTVTTLPFGGEYWAALVGLSGRPPEEDRRISLDYIGQDYFRAMGMPLLKGRYLQESDNTLAAAAVVVINETLERTLFRGSNPLGQHIRVNQTDSTIVGVVSDVRHTKLNTAPDGHVYGPQIVNPVTVCLVVRARNAPAILIKEIRDAVAKVDPSQSVSNFRTLEQAVDRSLEERRITLYLLGVFAVFALGLACIGIYGIMSYNIVQREREFSIRMAIGAGRASIVRRVFIDGLRMGAIGVALGLAASFAAARIIESRLYEISAFDPTVFALVPLFILSVVALSIYLPALRASRFEAVNALRAG